MAFLTMATVEGITPRQLRRLQTLWHRWTRPLKFSAARNRSVRHAFVELFTGGHARQTKELSRKEASQVIETLEQMVRVSEHKANQAAGTAGRRGFPERRRVHPTAVAWRAFWGTAQALGMDRERLERFIAAHYGGVGLRRVADIHSMADLNRVLWGLKAMLRRQRRDESAEMQGGARKAA